MFECEDRGVLSTGGKPWLDQEVAAAIGGDTAENLACITELVEKMVISRNESGSLFCRRMVREEEDRSKTRLRVQKFRWKHVTPSVTPMKRQCTEDEDVHENETAIETENATEASRGITKGESYHPDTRIALWWLIEKSGRHFREVDANLTVISQRLKEPGVELEGVKTMIERQCKRWLNTSQSEYLRPETLFGKTKFDSYYAARNLPINTEYESRNGKGSVGHHPVNNRNATVCPTIGPSTADVLASRKAEREREKVSRVERPVATEGSSTSGNAPTSPGSG